VLQPCLPWPLYKCTFSSILAKVTCIICKISTQVVPVCFLLIHRSVSQASHLTSVCSVQLETDAPRVDIPQLNHGLTAVELGALRCRLGRDTTFLSSLLSCILRNSFLSSRFPRLLAHIVAESTATTSCRRYLG
jgi:hypothetical protein